MNLLDVKTEWRKIPNLPDRYEVSDSGLVRVLSREVLVRRKDGTVRKRKVEGRILSSYVRPNGKSRGHPVVSISGAVDEDRNFGEMRVCLIVCRAFHGVPYEPGDLNAGQTWRVRHKDGDILNVSADNLEWAGNPGAAGHEARSLYERNLHRLAELREEPVENWIKRMWGNDALDFSA